jgi:hypothetical protein
VRYHAWPPAVNNRGIRHVTDQVDRLHRISFDFSPYSNCKREGAKGTGSLPNLTENLAKSQVTVPVPLFSRPVTNTVGPSGRGTGTKAANFTFSNGYARSAALEPVPFPDSVYTLSTLLLLQQNQQASGTNRESPWRRATLIRRGVPAVVVVPHNQPFPSQCA